MAMVVSRFEVWLINLEPTQGAEINKVRPCVIVSPDEVNLFLKTVLVAPLTTTRRDYPTRVDCYFDNKAGQVALDQMRAVDKSRLLNRMGVLETTTCEIICDTLQVMFEY